MDYGTIIVWGLMALVLNLLLLSFVIRHAIDQSKLTKQLAELTDEVRTLRRELAKEKQHIVDKRV